MRYSEANTSGASHAHADTRRRSIIAFYAHQVHGATRARQRAPYIVHPAGLSSIVIADGGSETRRCGALHYAREDRGDASASKTSAQSATRSRNRSRTAPTLATPRPWAERKPSTSNTPALTRRASRVGRRQGHIAYATARIADMRHFGSCSTHRGIHLATTRLGDRTGKRRRILVYERTDRSGDRTDMGLTGVNEHAAGVATRAVRVGAAARD